MKTYEDHLALIKARVKARLEELNLLEQMPSDGILRIFSDIHLEYWGTQEGDPPEDALEPGQADATLSLTKDGKPVAEAHIVGEAMYFAGHRFTIEEGKLLSSHFDGSPCQAKCISCPDPDIRVATLDEETYVFCLNCGAKTEMYAEKWFAIGDWLIRRAKV